jgi:hypothetical protein
MSLHKPTTPLKMGRTNTTEPVLLYDSMILSDMLHVSAGNHHVFETYNLSCQQHDQAVCIE